MFLRCKHCFKNGKPHRYYSVVENRRCRRGKVVQRQVLYLGEINDSQEAAWRKTLKVFDEDQGQELPLALFPDDRPIPPDELNALSLRMDRLALRRPRCFGNCWLGLHLWQELQLDQFWAGGLREHRAEVPWEKVLAILAINRLCDPGSEWRVHRQWFLTTALDELLGTDFSAAGKARRTWVMDRGIPTEEVLKEMRQEGIHYLVGTPKSLLSRQERQFVDKPWEQVHEAMRVKLLEQDQELYVLAHSQQRKKKENAMRRRKMKNLISGLNHLKPWRRKDKGKGIKRDNLLERVAVLKKEAGRVASFVKVTMPRPDEPINRSTFRIQFERERWNHSLQWDGAYILRGYLPEESRNDAPALWEMYMQLTQVEESFKTLKSDIAVRPIWHFTEKRVEAHILVAFLGYCLSASLRMKLSKHAPGLTPREVLEILGQLRMVDVCIPTTDGRRLIMPRYTEPETEQLMVLEKLRLQLPAQPPPRVRGKEVAMT